MARITLTEEQARQIQADGTAELYDPQGRLVAVLPPEFTAEGMAKLRRARERNGPRYSGEQVRQWLAELEEAWQKEGPFDKARMRVLLDDWRARQV